MRLELTGRNLEITPSLRQLIERKLTKLDRVLNDSAVSAQIVLTAEKYRCVADITVHARGDHMLHGLGDGTTWPRSVTAAVEKVAQQAHRLKDKWEKRKRRAAPAKGLPAMALSAAGEGAGRPPRIVRALRYPIKPMSVEDAALKVDAEDSAFLVFRNATTDTINILYKRKDGHLGLIEPEA